MEARRIVNRLPSNRGMIGALLLIMLLSLCCCRPTAHAEGGLALSGSFYRQALEIPQGASAGGPSLYVVVFNNGDTPFSVRMSADAPPGVSVLFDADAFELKAGSQRQVLITVEVSQAAAPGAYDLSVSAEPLVEKDGQIQVLGAAGQTAQLVVVGEGAQVAVNMVDAEGQAVRGVVRLYRQIDGQRVEVAYSQEGALEAIVAPGEYTAEALMGDESLTEQTFSVVADEMHSVALMASTVYFEAIEIVPSVNAADGSIAYAQVVYTIKNLYRPMDNAEVELRVSHDGADLETVSLGRMSRLELGRLGLSQHYLPASGWQAGQYGFTLELRFNGQLYARSETHTLDHAPAEAPVAGTGWLIGGIVTLLLVGLGVAGWLGRKRIAAVIARLRTAQEPPQD